MELVVTGTELYATYETPDGYPAVYDDRAGLFCFARVVDGQFDSTGVPVNRSRRLSTSSGMRRESDAVRSRKIAGTPVPDGAARSTHRKGDPTRRRIEA